MLSCPFNASYAIPAARTVHVFLWETACQRDATSRALRFPPPSRRARARRSHPTHPITAESLPRPLCPLYVDALRFAFPHQIAPLGSGPTRHTFLVRSSGCPTQHVTYESSGLIAPCPTERTARLWRAQLCLPILCTPSHFLHTFPFVHHIASHMCMHMCCAWLPIFPSCAHLPISGRSSHLCISSHL